MLPFPLALLVAVGNILAVALAVVLLFVLAAARHIAAGEMALHLEDPVPVSVIQRRRQYRAVLHDCPQSVLIIVFMHKIVNKTSEIFNKFLLPSPVEPGVVIPLKPINTIASF